MVVYARYEYPRGYQELSKHLTGTAIKIEKLLRTRIVKHTIDQLAQLTRVNFSEVIEAAKTAAVFHDIGKALHYYQKQAYEVVKGEGKKYMSFIFHELISANIYAKVIKIHLNQVSQYPYSKPWLANLTMQAILLHHQGLRMITIEKLYSDIISNIIANQLSNSIQNMQSVIKDLYTSVSCKISNILLNI
ncbi:MAG: CRISPR-associated endonuclease Cas3'', partial [Candidatus Bathyarchaeia archaeon]